jgi:hypothetical protein
LIVRTKTSAEADDFRLEKKIKWMAHHFSVGASFPPP